MNTETRASDLEIEFFIVCGQVDWNLRQDMHRHSIEERAGQAVVAATVEAELTALVDYRLIEIDVIANERISKRRMAPTDWRRRKSWRNRPKRQRFSAEIVMDLSPWSRSKRVPESEWLPLETLFDEYVRIGTLVVAQIAVLRGEESSRLEQLLKSSGVGLDEVFAAAGRKPVPIPRFDFNLTIEVVHGLVDGQGNLDLRERMRKAMTQALSDARLGRYDGGSSSDEHFEFGFLVRDVQQSRKILTDVLNQFPHEAHFFDD